MEFGQVELNLLLAGELTEIEVVVWSQECQPIRFSDAPYVVCSRDRACARHVLDDDFRITRYVLVKIFRYQPRRLVIATA